MLKFRSAIAGPLIIATVLILASCTENQNTDKIEKVDSLSMVLDETELMFKEINIDSLRQLFEIYQYNTDEIKKSYSKEDEEGWKIVCRYNDMKKPFRNLVEYYDNISSELNFSRQQLDSLKQDLQNNLITEERAEEYIIEEEKAIGYLHKMVSNNLISSNVIINDFDSLNTLVEKVVGEINKPDTRSLKPETRRKKN